MTSRLRRGALLACAVAGLLGAAAACGSEPTLFSAGSTGTTAGTAGTGGTGGTGGNDTTTGTGGTGGTSGTGGSSGSQGTGGSPAGPIVIVQATPTLEANDEDPSASLPAPPAAGNAIIVGITCFSEVDNCTIPPGGVTDNQGNVYQLVIEGSSIVSSITHGSRGYIFIAEAITPPNGALTITVNPNGSPVDNFQHLTWGAIEVSGLAQPNSLDQTGSFPNTCCPDSTTVTTSGATSQANELAVAIHTLRSNDGDVNYGHDPTWTEHHVTSEGVSGSPHSMVTKILSATGMVSHAWTHDVPTRGVSAIIATFRGASGG